MAEEVTLPQLGESVTEGIITEWLVEVGDTVETDQPLVEISTDKVDTEIPSPVSGTVQELKADVDDTVEVGQVIAIIGEAEGASGDGGDGEEDGGAEEDTGAEEDGDEAEEATEAAAEEAAAPEETEEAAEAEADTSGEEASDEAEASAEDGGTATATEATPAQPPAPGTGDGDGAGDGAGDKALTSPIVRKMLREAGISPGQVEGTGKGGRITRKDAEQAIESGVGEAKEAEAARPAPAAPAAPTPSAPPTQRERPEASPLQVDFDGQREVTQDLSRVRKAIAKAMHASLQQTAQLTAAVEVDVTRVMQLRAAVKEDFKSHYGVSLSPLPFFARATCMTIPRHPAINGSIDLDSGTATFHRYINLGLAVDTDRGLLVPNIKDAQDLNIPGLAKQIADIAQKTRSGKGLTPDDIQGGTFTITNTGSRGTLFDTPILNPPEVAILATCAIEKRAVVVQDELGGDSISVRSMMYLCLTYDHRMIDGADAARFLQDLKWVIETHDFSSEVTV